MSLPDLERMRVSDEEREAVAAQLRDALDAGRLQLHEFDERTRELYDAQTYAEVNRLLEDLPAADLAVPSPPVLEPRRPEVVPAQAGTMENGMGTAALITGLMSFFGGFPFPVLAIVFGAIGMQRVKEGRADNRASALAGLILGPVALGIWITILVIGSIYWW